MKRIAMPAVLAILSLLLCTCVQAYTLTFDDVPSGQPLADYYGGLYGAGFNGWFDAVDHSSSTWGPPHSGGYVMRCLWPRGWSGAECKFMFWPSEKLYSITSLGAYYSTEPGAVIRLDAFHYGNSQPVSSVTIGSAGQSWNNVYASVNSPTGQIDYVMFYSVSSEDALQHFCADDMTIAPVPEPSALMALAGGLGALGLPLIRRKRR